MAPDGQKVRTEWTDGHTDDAKTISLRLRRGIIKYLQFYAENICLSGPYAFAVGGMLNTNKF